MVPCNPLNTSHKATINKEANDLADSLSREIGSVESSRSLAVRFQTLATAETLITLPILPKFLASCLAIMAGHWIPF